MTIDLEKLPPEAREEIERLRSVNASMGAYLKMVEAYFMDSEEAVRSNRGLSTWWNHYRGTQRSIHSLIPART